MKEDCFIRVTNKDIYNKITGLESKFDKIVGKTSIAFWASATALTLSIVGIGLKLT
jgi:hypothetical protein